MREVVAIWSNAIGFGSFLSFIITFLRRGKFLFLPIYLFAQTPTFLPIKPGSLTLSFSLINPSGRIVTTVKSINIINPDIVTLEAYVALQPPRWTGQGVVNKPFCVFVQGKDSLGNIVTGKHWITTNSDTTLIRVTMSSSVCGGSDTTVDISKILANPFPPL